MDLLISRVLVEIALLRCLNATRKMTVVIIATNKTAPNVSGFAISLTPVVNLYGHVPFVPRLKGKIGMIGQNAVLTSTTYK